MAKRLKVFLNIAGVAPECLKKFFLEAVPCNICCDILLLVLRAQTLVAQRPPQRAHSTPGTTQRWRWVIMVNQPPDGCPERELHETPWKKIHGQTNHKGGGRTHTQTQRHTQTHKHTHAHTHKQNTQTRTQKKTRTQAEGRTITHMFFRTGRRPHSTAYPPAQSGGYTST